MTKQNMNENRIVIILFFLVGIIGFVSQVLAATCNCGDTITESVVLDTDLICTGDGLIVGANNITIDGGNHTITGDGGVGDYGIDDSGGYDTIIIQNFANITNFSVGVRFLDVDGSTIQYVTANSNGNGFLLDRINYNDILNNTCSGNTSAGISMDVLLTHGEGVHSTYNDIIGNTTIGNLDGINMLYSNYNNVINNVTNNNSGCGILLDDTDYNVLNGNTANNNSIGSWVYLSRNTNLTGNIFGNNDLDGINLSDNSDNNSFINNITNNNGRTGINVEGSNLNSLTGNICDGNTASGIAISFWDEYEIPSDQNTLTSNHCSNNDIGISIDRSSDNVVSLNSLLDNTTNNATDNSAAANDWDSAGRGNYWDDWQSPDANSNGIVDNPRPITGGDSQDGFPLVDVTGPTCSISSISESSIYGYSSSSTIYYNTASSGSFTVDVSAGDTESGVFKVNFPATVSTSGDDTDSPYALIYDWDTSDTFSQSSDVTCYDNLNNSQTTSFTVARDITAPSGGTISYNNGYYETLSIPITYALGSDDSGSGLNSSTGKIQRKETTLSADTCGTFGSWSDLATDSDGSYSDNTVSSCNCYQYRYLISDNVSNQATYTSSNIAKIGNPPDDTDSDGMSDTWETANGLDLFDPADASTDADNDGWTNLQEYQLGFDPNNASPVKPVGLSPSGAGITLNPTLEGSDYSDTENDPHIFTEWQVSSDTEFLELTFADTTPVDKQTIQIPIAILKPETTYYWRLRYSDLSGWSAWSDTVEFTTESSADFLAENTNIDTTDTIASDTGTIQSYLQSPDTFPDLPSGYLFYGGIFSFRIEGITPGATVSVTFQLYEPFQQDYKWFKYYPYLEEWDDTYATHITSGIGTNQVTIEFKDGGFGDIDGLENGIIVDPSGPGIFVEEPTDDNDNKQSSCFIATACYGTPMASEVRVLSRFRDRYLLTNPIGESFVNTYYKVSPVIADFVREHPGLKRVVRIALKPAVWMSGKID